MKSKRTPFPVIFWTANTIEIFERFAYYGIYMGFGIYMQHLGFSEGKLSVVQSIFLAFSYLIPVISGTFADRYGFKKVLIVSYLTYLPSILLLLVTKSFPGIALAMLSIGLAAGIFKPLISGTIRVSTDKTNKTMGFGIFYLMVNFGASFGPLIAGKLRAISWNYAFLAGAISVGVMLLITLLFYKEPERELSGVTLKEKMKEIGQTLSDYKLLTFLILLGIFFWLPFWSFFNVLALYIDNYIDTARLYTSVQKALGTIFANLISGEDTGGTMRILGESISHTGYIIVLFQFFVSRGAEKFRAIPTLLVGMVIAALGLMFLGYAYLGHPAFVFLGIFLFATGEMVSSPRMQEYVTWIAPKEKAGLYMGSFFLSIGLGGLLSGFTYTNLFGYFSKICQPENIWYVLAFHLIIGIVAISLFTKIAGKFKEQEK